VSDIAEHIIQMINLKLNTGIWRISVSAASLLLVNLFDELCSLLCCYVVWTVKCECSVEDQKYADAKLTIAVLHKINAK